MTGLTSISLSEGCGIAPVFWAFSSNVSFLVLRRSVSQFWLSTGSWEGSWQSSHLQISPSFVCGSVSVGVPLESHPPPLFDPEPDPDPDPLLELESFPLPGDPPRYFRL